MAMQGSADDRLPGGVGALIVAGGHGERMRESGSAVAKPLVPVRGVPVLERNVLTLLGAGFTDLHIAVSARRDGVGDFARTRCRALAEALGASLSVVTEEQPLGSIGAASLLTAYTDVVVVNADNLTALDLRAMLAFHRDSGAALTLAVHDQPFPMPFGEIVADGDRVVAYREKPTLTVRVCSAISVLGREALAALIPGEAIGLPAFANRLLGTNAPIRAFVHQAPWIDVNDLSAAARAEVLLRDRADQFEIWASHPDDEVAALLLCSGRNVALQRHPAGAWCLPRSAPTSKPAVVQTARSIARRYGVEPLPLATVDDVDTVRKRIIRTHLFSADLADTAVAADLTWFPQEQVGDLDHVAPLVSRALAIRAQP
ncbi:MAG TPA: sugar phosphate nucleotidyltransferase [Pseudomonadales bacterium]